MMSILSYLTLFGIKNTFKQQCQMNSQIQFEKNSNVDGADVT
jgi:hypothetical protein